MFTQFFWYLFFIFKTSLMAACNKGNIEVVKFLLKQESIDINAKDVYLNFSKFIDLTPSLALKFDVF